MDTNRDEQLWRIAKQRAGFQRGLVSYFVINAFLWIIWWFTSGRNSHGIPWPAWAMLGWGLGLVFQYFAAYGGSKESLADKEYEKLKREKEDSV
ncbi:MAG: hypothetical protein JWN83_518 [Chitinophagaceae bacterium]|nr:hypothetical protein [Chitinophagaceae bacterium]